MSETAIETTRDLASIPGLEIEENVNAPNRANQIIYYISETMNISIDDIMSRKRDRDIVNARQLCVYFVHSFEVHLTLKAVGRKFNRDHSTVIHCIQKVDDICLFDKRFKQLFDRLQIGLKNKFWL